jgi:hypothetical protein
MRLTAVALLVPTVLETLLVAGHAYARMPLRTFPFMVDFMLWAAIALFGLLAALRDKQAATSVE